MERLTTHCSTKPRRLTNRAEIYLVLLERGCSNDSSNNIGEETPTHYRVRTNNTSLWSSTIGISSKRRRPNTFHKRDVHYLGLASSQILSDITKKSRSLSGGTSRLDPRKNTSHSNKLQPSKSVANQRRKHALT